MDSLMRRWRAGLVAASRDGRVAERDLQLSVKGDLVVARDDRHVRQPGRT